jgi:hypothetical protein
VTIEARKSPRREKALVVATRVDRDRSRGGWRIVGERRGRRLGGSGYQGLPGGKSLYNIAVREVQLKTRP